MRFRRIVSARRQIAVPLVLGLCALGVGGGLAVEQARGERWESTSQVVVDFWAVSPYLLSAQAPPVTPADVADATAFAQSEDVLSRVADELRDGRDVAQLGEDVTVTPTVQSHVLSIVATAPTAEGARRTAEAVPEAMADALQDRIDAAADGAEDATPEIRQRAEVLLNDLFPLQDLGASEPQRVSPSTRTPIALGIVGFAAGSLVVIALTFAGPVLLRPREAQRVVDLPTVPFRRSGGGHEASGLVQLLIDQRPTGVVLVVPVRPGVEGAAEEFAEWARRRTRDDTEAKRVVAVRSPDATVLSPRPGPDEVAAVLLVVPRGTTRHELNGAAGLLHRWRPVDALVFVT